MRRVLAATVGAWLAAWVVCWAVPASAQQGTTIAISTRAAEVSDVLLRGKQLETERRWGDALTHYEDAIHQYPGDTGLQRRFELTRLHYDLGRRYADHSFAAALGNLPFEKSLDMYSQVLLKIQAHYVDAPKWRDLLTRGCDGIEVALSEPVFIEKHVPARKRLAIEDFCREVRKAMAARTVNSRTDAREAVAAAARLAQQRLEIRPTAVVLEYLCGASNMLDPYSTYLTPDQLNEVYAQIDGNFVGLGVELKPQDGGLLIVRVIRGSPAEAGGLRANDQIVSINGQPVRATSGDSAINALQGEEGSVVQLSVVTRGAAPRQVTIRRRRIDVPSVDQVGIVDSERGIAYLKITCFQKTTARDLDAALWRLHREGMKSLVIDLRGNPGGLLVASVEAVDRFVERGTIVSTRGRSAQEDITYSAHSEGTWQVPLIVLIDQNSASAAEIFAGAVRDHHRGTIVGVRSYGKGSVQGIFPLEGYKAGVRLTTAKFYSPSGKPYSGVGVEPDVLVQRTARPIEGETTPGAGEEDAMLAAALQAARNVPPSRQASR
jgi:carboxyl-terminal processing protease